MILPYVAFGSWYTLFFVFQDVPRKLVVHWIQQVDSISGKVKCPKKRQKTAALWQRPYSASTIKHWNFPRIEGSCIASVETPWSKSLLASSHALCRRWPHCPGGKRSDRSWKRGICSSFAFSLVRCCKMLMLNVLRCGSEPIKIW